jgi:hypothetical protein
MFILKGSPMITLSQEIYDALCSDPLYDEIETVEEVEVQPRRRTSILNDF